MVAMFGRYRSYERRGLEVFFSEATTHGGVVGRLGLGGIDY